MEVEADPTDSERQIKKTTLRLKPTTTLTLLAHDGTTVALNGDEALLSFITANRASLAAYLNERFDPLYRFDYNGLARFLDPLRLNGQYPLYTAQKHVIGAITRGFAVKDRLLLCGQMGTGKTLVGSTTGIAIASGAVAALRGQMKPDQVILIVAPPHLIEKWQRELTSTPPQG